MKHSVLFLTMAVSLASAQPKIADFTTLTPGTQPQNLMLPSTHTFQRLIKTGDALTGGGTLPTGNDFTGYVPIGGSSTNGYLSINHENTPGGVTILDLVFNTVTKVWNVTASNAINFAGVQGTQRNCSGGVSPMGTIFTAEETSTSTDANSDGFEDLGWLVELNPATRSVVGKRFKMGVADHENVCFKSDASVAYWGADNGTTGFVYKFVPTVPGDFSAGSLFVLDLDAAIPAVGSTVTGTWRSVANATAANCNNTPSLASSAGGTNFNGVEDVEVLPTDNSWIYFTAKGPGRVYRFQDNGATVSNFSIYVESQNYDVDGAGPIGSTAWGTGNDNLAFDGENNLWVLQDGGNGHIWLVRNGHSLPGNPRVELFGRTPAGSEPTGITFSPDYNYMFISFQHPNGSNATGTVDATGTNVVFNTPTTVVIARKEFLGAATFPVTFNEILAYPVGAKVRVEWTTGTEQNLTRFEVERSFDGINFHHVGQVNATGNSNSPSYYSYMDSRMTGTRTWYRVKSVDRDGTETLSQMVEVTTPGEMTVGLYPNPFQDKLQVKWNSATPDQNARFELLDMNGAVLFSQVLPAVNGVTNVDLTHLPAGSYFLVIRGENQPMVVPVVKQ